MQAVVLDTNAVMDWLVFRDPALRRLAEAIERRRIDWLVSDETCAELAHVLGRGVAAAWQPDVAAILATVERCARCVAAPQTATTHRLRCTDADDQKFIDLALTHHATWLVTRDRAVLKLAKRALPHGLSIVTPARWALAPPA